MVPRVLYPGVESACQCQRLGFDPWVGKIPLQKEMATHSTVLTWKNPMDRGAWQATVHGVARVRDDLATEPPPPMGNLKKSRQVQRGWEEC